MFGKKFFILAILSAIFLVIWAFFTEEENVTKTNSKDSMDALVIRHLSDRLKRPAAFASTIRTEAGEWRFICGTATETDGSDLKVADTPLGARITDGSATTTFCALFNVQMPNHLTEFDFGFTDMPAFDWLDRHDLPMDILSEPSE